jgi:hypothetical protein
MKEKALTSDEAAEHAKALPEGFAGQRGRRLYLAASMLWKKRMQAWLIQDNQ